MFKLMTVQFRNKWICILHNTFFYINTSYSHDYITVPDKEPEDCLSLVLKGHTLEEHITKCSTELPYICVQGTSIHTI